MGNEFRRQIKTADDQDVHTGWRKIAGSLRRAGAAARLKRATNQRERREARRVTRNASDSD